MANLRPNRANDNDNDEPEGDKPSDVVDSTDPERRDPNLKDADAVRVASDGTEFTMPGAHDTKSYYLTHTDGDGLPERVDADELPNDTPAKGYATAEEINRYQADEDSDKSGVDLTPSTAPRNAVS